MSKKVIGIVGGMGPLATADLFKKIVINTKAEKDQDHIRVLIDNNTNIPDRTGAILHGGEDPVPELTKSAKALENMGADLLIMPCNTAHYFHKSVAGAVNIPVLHMIEITCKALKLQGIKKAGLLATDGTIQSGIYQKVFNDSGIELIKPDEKGQEAVMDMIYGGVKASKWDFDTTAVKEAMEALLVAGAETLILGCTELPLAKEMYSLDYPSVDPTLELAREAIRQAGKEIV